MDKSTKYLTFAALALCALAVYIVLSRPKGRIRHDDFVENSSTNNNLTTNPPLNSPDTVIIHKEDPNVVNAQGSDGTNVKDLDAKDIDEEPSEEKDRTPQTSNLSNKNDDNDITSAPIANKKKKNVAKPVVNTFKYWVLAGSFVDTDNAKKELTKVKAAGFPNAVIAKPVSTKYASVVVGKFNEEAKANALVEQLKAKGITAYKHTKK